MSAHLGVLGCKIGCLSALGASPLRGSFTFGALFTLSLFEPEREDDELLLVADDEEPPCRFALVVFLAALGEAPGVAGMDLSEWSCTSMTSKLSCV